MKKNIVHQLDRFDLDEVCEMIADGASLALLGATFGRCPNVIKMAGRVEANSTRIKIN